MGCGYPSVPAAFGALALCQNGHGSHGGGGLGYPPTNLHQPTCNLSVLESICLGSSFPLRAEGAHA